MLRICLVCLVFILGIIDGARGRSNHDLDVTAAVPVDRRRHQRAEDAQPEPERQTESRTQPDKSIQSDSRRQPDKSSQSESQSKPDKSSQPDSVRQPDTPRQSDSRRQPDKSRQSDSRRLPDTRQDSSRRRPHSIRKKPIARIQNAYDVQYEVNNEHIRSGNLTDTLNYPYMAAVMINGRLWCAGAIVDVGWVLTAAHCLNYVLSVLSVKSLNRYVKVRVGSVKPHEGGELVDVAGAVRHPKFEEEPVPHSDLALLKLQNNLEFSKYINLIRIYDGSREPYAQSFITVAGWGATSGSSKAFREHTSNMLMARLKVRTHRYCEDAYQLVSGFQFGEDMFCASLRNGTRDACLFDAGAPAVQHNALMGIMSFGPERCGGTQPAVFIRALYFRDFVKHTIVQYKTTSELIDAMKEAESGPSPPMMDIAS